MDKKILFVHTGGTPIFCDYLNDHHIDGKTSFIFDFNEVTSFLKKVDNDFVVPLSKRVDIEEYVKKILIYGNIIAIKENGLIKSLLMFYSNDTKSKIAYFTLAVTEKDSRGKGYASLLFNNAEKICLDKGMEAACLHTDVINPAINLYKKLGYTIVETINKKVKMIKRLKK